MITTAHPTLWSMIKSCSFATLVTVERSGALRAWPLTSSQQQFDGNLWFFIANDSPAVANIEAEPQVCVVYPQAPTHIACADVVSVSGAALIVTNIAQKQRLWNPVVQACFPQGPQAGNLVLIRIAVEYADYWDAQLHKLVRLSMHADAPHTALDVVVANASQRALLI